MKRLSTVIIALLLFAQNAYSASPVPDGLIVKDGYEQGIGAPIGSIQLVQGSVIIIHAGDTHGYLAQKDLSLYKGDTIITREDGRVSLKLNDGSILTLTTATKLVINESIYDPSKENRSSFVSMTIGKARFLIQRLSDFKNSDFTVKTQTAVVGVRGSDFIVEAGENFTKVTALENTQIEVVSLTMPCKEDKKTAQKCKVEPVTLTDFEQAVVHENALPMRAAEILPEESERIKKEFTIKPEDGHVPKKDTAALDREIYLIPKTELISPEEVKEAIRLEASLPDLQKAAASPQKKEESVIRKDETDRQEYAADQQGQIASESLHEKVISELPGFPKAPQK